MSRSRRTSQNMSIPAGITANCSYWNYASPTFLLCLGPLYTATSHRSQHLPQSVNIWETRWWRPVTWVGPSVLLPWGTAQCLAHSKYVFPIYWQDLSTWTPGMTLLGFLIIIHRIWVQVRLLLFLQLQDIFNFFFLNHDPLIQWNKSFRKYLILQSRMYWDVF